MTISVILRRLRASAPDILREMLSELADLRRSNRHIDGLRRDLEPFVAQHPRIKAWTVGRITLYLRNLTVGDRRRDNILCAIVQLARFARRRNYLPEDRRSAAEKISRIKPGHDVTTWTLEESKLLLEHVSPRWLPHMAIGLFAGLRTSEILRLDWGDVDFDERVIVVSRKVARKTRTSRVVPIQPNLITWLEPYRDRVGPLYPGNFKTNENAHSQEMKRIRRATGVLRKDNANRHSFGSYRLAVTKSYDQVAHELGNSPRMVRQNYNHPKAEARGLAYFNLARPSYENVLPMPLPLEFS